MVVIFAYSECGGSFEIQIIGGVELQDVWRVAQGQIPVVNRCPIDIRRLVQTVLHYKRAAKISLTVNRSKTSQFLPGMSSQKR